MSLKKIEQVKADKGFKIWDLIIYGIVVALVAVFFILMFTVFDRQPLTGVKISVKAEVVFEYEFGGEFKLMSESVEVEENNNGITVTIHTADGGLNVAYIDKSAKTVKMSEANCRGKQCTYFTAISNNSGYIICDPHGIKIEPLIKDWDSPDIII